MTIEMMTWPCACYCHDRGTVCENGCLPKTDEPVATWSGWTCNGGTLEKLIDNRED